MHFMFVIRPCSSMILCISARVAASASAASRGGFVPCRKPPGRAVSVSIRTVPFVAAAPFNRRRSRGEINCRFVETHRRAIATGRAASPPMEGTVTMTQRHLNPTETRRKKPAAPRESSDPIAKGVNMSSSDTAGPIITQTHSAEGGDILQITINRPQVHNCVNRETAAALLEAWQRFRDDDSLVVAILHGTGDDAFCSGADLSGLQGLNRLPESSPTTDPSAPEGTGPMGGSRIVQTKPVITVSQGHTYAGGLELFCHGHIRLAEPQARFSVACRRWGVPLVDGGTVYLPRLLGWGPALPLIITGQRIDAQRAYEVGLVWELVERGKGLKRAMSMARQICQQPRDAMLADLGAAMRGSHLGLEEALTLEGRNLAPVAASESMRKGVERFLSGARFWFE